MKPNLRKNLLINPKFQIRIALYICCFSIIGIGLFYVSNLYFFYQLKREGLALGLPADHIYFQFLSEQEMFFHLLFVLMSIFILVVLSLAGIILSHKIAGPIFRLSHHMEDSLKEGQFGEVNFRSNDFFMELAITYNKLISEVNKRLGKR